MRYDNNAYPIYRRPISTTRSRNAFRKNTTNGKIKDIKYSNVSQNTDKEKLDTLYKAIIVNVTKRTSELKLVYYAFQHHTDKLSTKLYDIALAITKQPDKQYIRLIHFLIELIVHPDKPADKVTDLFSKLVNSPKPITIKDVNDFFDKISARNNYLNLFDLVGLPASEHPEPHASWLPKLKKLAMDIGNKNVDPATGAIKWNKKFAWLTPAYRFVHVMTHPAYSKAWIIPIYGDKVDEDPKDKNKFHLGMTETNLARYKELKKKGYKSQGVWLQNRKDRNHDLTKLVDTIAKAYNADNPGEYYNRFDFVSDFVQWIESELNMTTENTVVQDDLKDGSTPYAMFIRMPITQDPKLPEDKRKYQYLFTRVIRTKNGTIQEIKDPTTEDIVDLLLSKLIAPQGLLRQIDDIPRMDVDINYNYNGTTISQPDRKKLTINPSKAKHGAFDGFMGVIWHLAFHAAWHGYNPENLIEAKKSSLHENILNTSLENFTKKFHTVLGKANNFVLTFLKDAKYNDNKDIYNDLLKHRNRFFEKSDGTSILKQVSANYNNPEKSGALLDPDSTMAKAHYKRLKDNAKHPIP